LLTKGGAVLVDVRSKEEFTAEHAPKSINIPLQLLMQALERLKGKTVITVCRSGARSAMAVNMLRKEGIEAFDGGAWNNWQ
jgi:rhodanese-related sulfurtransferase